MRFSLQDVRKSIRRRGDELHLSLHFLRPGELQSEIERLIAYYERLLGQPKRLFAADEARTCIGEYRLADCLAATLSAWYSWQARAWHEVTGPLGGTPELLQLSPGHLRLELYRSVNAKYQGFLTAQQRSEALRDFAAGYGIGADDLEYLLALDSEGETLLVREAPTPPTAQDVATLYNQWVFEAALFNASTVRFVIDCAAFTRADSPDALTVGTEGGVGTVIKRLCYLARRMGVYYDLAYEVPEISERQNGKKGVTQGLLLALTLYGPQEVTGAPQQYGMRLARLCRTLLGYSRSSVARTGKKPSLSNAVTTTEATVHIQQRTYQFSIDATVLRLLPPIADTDGRPDKTGTTKEVTTLFDSSIEQTFSEAFQALASGTGVEGWRLEREPEPLLLTKSILIPDFALTRGTRRIYVEILGFWTPSYRERKIQKLRQLQERDDLLLMIPQEARDAYTEIAMHFPVIYYRGQLAIADLVQVLRQHYDDFATRLLAVDPPALCIQVKTQGFLSEKACYIALNCYRHAEIQQAAEHICTDDAAEGQIAFVPGLGLYHRQWLEQLQQSFLSRLQEQRTMPLSEAIQIIKRAQPILESCEETSIETLLALWPEISIRRDSIFETVIELASERDERMAEQENEQESLEPKPAKKQRREKRSTTKKREVDEPETVQGNLWG